MLKKSISVLAFISVIVASLFLTVSAEDFTATNSGFSNVTFSDGYRGFCIDASLSGAENGDTFTSAKNTSVADHNATKEDVSQKLKILITQCLNEIFVSDGNGGYVMDSLKADSSVQSAVWNITDDRYVWGESKTFVEKVNAYSGPEIPDEGYMITLENGDTITFYFKVFEPQKSGQQSFFAYKIVTNEVPEHEHNHDELKSDDENHWYECDCGDTVAFEEHGFIDGVCPDCGKVEEESSDEDKPGTDVKPEDKPGTDVEPEDKPDIDIKPEDKPSADDNNAD